MQLKESEESSATNQWMVLNRFLFIYKAAGAGLALVCVALGVLAIFLATQDPVVVLIQDKDQIYLHGRRANPDIDEASIRRTVERFVRSYYEWKTLDPQAIGKSIAPLVTEGFKEKAIELLETRKAKEFAGKTIRQDVAGLEVSVTKDATLAVFDVILRINGIPLIVPTQVSFQLVKGSQNEWNPVGLYVNGMKLHEAK